MATDYEYYEGSNTSLHVGSDTPSHGGVNMWFAQTFTVGTVGTNENFNIYSIKVYGDIDGSPSGVLTASIRATSGGAPTGGDLCSGTASFPSGTEWTEVIMSTNPTLSASTKYALVIRATGADHDNYYGWNYHTYNGYAGGEVFQSADNGSSWSSTLDWPYTSGGDAMFQIWGNFAANSYAYSSSINYNNGTVYAATLTATTTGVVHFDLSSDGGTTWYPCTSGVQCVIYPNWGTDLRWRAGGAASATLTALEINGILKF